MNLSAPSRCGVLAPAALAVCALVLPGCATADADAGLRIQDPAVGAVPGSSAAVYLAIDNPGAADSLLGADCSCGAETSLHVVEDRAGVLMMVPAGTIEIPEDSTTVLDPGGSHVMLEGLQEPLEPGGSIELTLRFDRAGERTVEVPVVELQQLAERVERDQ
ncbi:MAG: copper chaperone PCu(A)C [Microthrixaceae bacterium]